MSSDVRDYLNALRGAMDGCDPALVQDALWDAEVHLNGEFKRLAWETPELSAAQAMERVIAAFGSPEEVAEAYRDREATVAEALKPPRRLDLQMDEPEQPAAPHPGFFEVLLAPRAYSSLIYLLLSMPLGIFYFTWAVVGLSLSAGLLVLVIGIPFLIVFLGTVRVLALGEGRLVEALLDVRMPRKPTLLPPGRTWGQKLAALLKDGHTWLSLLYMVLQLPLGICYFTFIVTALSLSLGCLAMPLAKWVFHAQVGLDFGVWDGTRHAWTPAAAALVGVLLLPLTLHLSLALGRLQGRLAKALLVKR